MSERLCPACSSWECAADDAYCGACGQPCAYLGIEVFPPVLHIRQIASNVAFRISNQSCVKLPVQQIRRPQWLTLLGQPPESIGPGDAVFFYGRAATLPMTEPAAAPVTVETPAGAASFLLMAIAQEPAIRTLPEELVIWVDSRRSGRQRIDFHFGPVSGSMRILNVGDANEPRIGVTGRPAFPSVASPSGFVPLTIDVDPTAFTGQPSITAGIAIEYDDAHGARTAMLPLHFAVDSRPELRWTGEDAPPPVRVQADKQPLKLVFRNGTVDDSQGGRANAPVVLESVTLIALRGDPDISVRQVSPLPQTIPGGGTCDVEFELNLEPLTPGIHTLQLIPRTNCAELNRQSFRASVDVRPLLDFDGYIAIDFGTSNTCCALLENGGEFEGVPLDGDSTTAPTIVQYLDMQGPFPEIRTGMIVKDQAAVDEKVASSTVQRLKQQLGETTYPLRVRPVSSQDWMHREARLAARDYLHDIRLSAQRKKGVTFRDFIVTHPAVCSIRQYRNLRSALLEAFGAEARVHFLQEPVAALVPFFDEKARNSSEPNYTVAAFDLGGGTTDVTVVRVRQIPENGGMRIQPEILASWGERFGGEDLTDFLVQLLKSRCRQILANAHPGFELADATVIGAATPDILRNDATLRNWADRFKANLSEEQSSKRQMDVLILRTISGRASQPAAFEPEQLESSGTASLRLVFLEHTRSSIGRIADRLQQTIGATPLQYIHLSGKTTFLPVIRDTLRAKFSSADISRAKDPKECVVRGACLSRSMAGNRTRHLVLPPETQRTTSRIGLMDEGTGQFQEVIPLDCPIPAGGLRREVANAWNGSDVIVVWENLGVVDTRLLPDGSRNPHLQKLGTWEPQAQVDVGQGSWWKLQLTLTTDFTLEVAAIGPDGATVPFKPHSSGGLP